MVVVTGGIGKEVDGSTIEEVVANGGIGTGTVTGTIVGGNITVVETLTGRDVVEEALTEVSVEEVDVEVVDVAKADVAAEVDVVVAMADVEVVDATMEVEVVVFAGHLLRSSTMVPSGQT